MSKKWCQKTIACLLASLFWTLPLTALPHQAVLGAIVGSEEASLGDVAVPNTGTILNNDLLTTGPQGKALIEFSPASRATLMKNTSVRFRSVTGHLIAEVSSGAMVVETRNGQGPVLITAKCKIAPVEQGKTIYYVALMPDRSTVVAAPHGSVAITEIRSGQTYILPGGQYASIPPTLPGALGQAASPNAKSAKPATGTWHIGSLSHAALAGLAAAIAAGIAAAITIPSAAGGRSVSPSVP